MVSLPSAVDLFEHAVFTPIRFCHEYKALNSYPCGRSCIIDGTCGSLHVWGSQPVPRVMQIDDSHIELTTAGLETPTRRDRRCDFVGKSGQNKCRFRRRAALQFTEPPEAAIELRLGRYCVVNRSEIKRRYRHEVFSYSSILECLVPLQQDSRRFPVKALRYAEKPVEITIMQLEHHKVVPTKSHEITWVVCK